MRWRIFFLLMLPPLFDKLILVRSLALVLQVLGTAPKSQTPNLKIHFCPDVPEDRSRDPLLEGFF
jgi:hypothetical protein